MPIEPGVRIGGYLVQEYVGRGAMGVVYRAFHEGLARPAAVKVLQALTPDSDALGRFRREAQSIAQMRHPSILNVFDFGEYEGTAYMIVEYVAGGSLDGRLTRGVPLPQAEALRLLKGLAAGLDYAHSLGVVHRDVKPANVLLGPGDSPILADFGLAKLLQSSSLKSMTGVATGTPAYMAPEQATGTPVGPAADRYALATMAYQLLTGTVPFQSEGVLELLYAHVHRDPDPASSRNPELNQHVDAVLARGLAKDPAERWASCAGFVDRLEAALTGRASTDTQPIEPPTQPVPGAQAVERTMPMPSPGGAAVRPRRSRRRLALIGLAVLAVIVAGLVLAALNRPKPLDLSLSSDTVAAGDTVVLTAGGLPKGQKGTVELASRPQVIDTFSADQDGAVEQTVTIPARTTEGDHELSLCWSNQCRVGTTIHVSAKPSPSPSPSPKPSAGPTPPPSLGRVSVSPVPLKPGGQIAIQGGGFAPNSRRGIYVVDSGGVKLLGEVAVAASGTFNFQGVLPATVAPPQLQLKVCAPGSSTTSLTECVDETVAVTR